MKPALIYLLVNDKENGPHKVEDLRERIDAGKLGEETLSCVEGMKGWRSLPETFVWAHGKLLAQVKLELNIQAKALVEGTTNPAKARCEIKSALQKVAFKILDFQSTEIADDIIDVVLETNACLMREHEAFSKRDQKWSLLLRAERPAHELICLCVSGSKFKRDWPAAWIAAGGKIFADRMIARQDDPVWMAISDFGFPFSPFSFDWMIDTQSVTRVECEKLGVPDLEQIIHLPDSSKIKLVGIQ